MLAIIFVATSGAFFSDYFRNHKMLSTLACTVALIGSYYLARGIWVDVRSILAPIEVITPTAPPSPDLSAREAEVLEAPEQVRPELERKQQIEEQKQREEEQIRKEAKTQKKEQEREEAQRREADERRRQEEQRIYEAKAEFSKRIDELRWNINKHKIEDRE
jgi:flagellar biosynthesis GTPase FlhF